MKKLIRVRTYQMVFCLIASLAQCAMAQDPAPPPTPIPIPPHFQEAFQTGVKLYQEKKFAEAKLAFQNAIQIEPNNLQALTNMGLTAFQLGEKGWALAYLRKAHHLDPDFSTPASALQFILPQLEVKEIPHEISTWETVRSKFIEPFSQVSFILFAALLLLASGWTWIQYFSARKKADTEEKPYPSFPNFGALYSLGFLLIFSLMWAKVYDSHLVRGTIVTNKTSVLSLPDEKAPAMFEIYAGLEVIVLNKQADWLQIQYPGGMTGWIKENLLLVTCGSLK